ncbi:Protein kinase C zeta type [Collichthys lucidus]|uniref:Protein kinase C zeta type n=1 Tax=Collichthys lucidus TaxID=240159 RepID=A0A4U5UPM6_COLLU|nr:Protein kinase C zeta type [Collichthys lucidus]
MLLLYNCFLSLLESIYRRGARRWRKLYRVNGHLFQAKRFNRFLHVCLHLSSPSRSVSPPPDVAVEKSCFVDLSPLDIMELCVPRDEAEFSHPHRPRRRSVRGLAADTGVS